MIIDAEGAWPIFGRQLHDCLERGEAFFAVIFCFFLIKQKEEEKKIKALTIKD